MTNSSAERREFACVLGLVLIFLCFTWRGLTMFFSDDDVMNMYRAWTTPALKLWKAQLLPWMAIPRPTGYGMYRIIYSLFGYHPFPLYFFCWILMAANVVVAWRCLRAVLPSVFAALIALALTLVHGGFQDLYLSAGTIYDQLCFLFTVLAVVLYVSERRVWAALACLMAMNSKESGAAAPLILFCYECAYVLPAVWREKRVGAWLRSIVPFYGGMAAVLIAYVVGRVRHAEGIAGNPLYETHLDIGLLLHNLAGYLSILAYRKIEFSSLGAAVVLIAMFALAIVLRNRAMVFGWLYFIAAITPVALIAGRGGYVLYVPLLGLGIYLAALLPARSEFTVRQMTAVAAVTLLMVWIHVRHWPEPWIVENSSEWRLSDFMKREYPQMKRGAKILFADDLPFINGYDPLFNIRLLYGDETIEVARIKGSKDQQPDPARYPEFDHVFTAASGNYVELDRRNVAESIRLNLLQDYPLGRFFDTNSKGAFGYVQSGVKVGQRGDGWWTAKSARLRFDVYPAELKLSLKFWVPDFIAKDKPRTLMVIVNDEKVGAVVLNHEGENRVEFPVAARLIRGGDYTIVGLDVDDPWIQNGEDFGVVLMQAGFEAASKH